MENRKMKPSGNKWIGDIPNEWVLTPLKYLYDNSRGSAVRVGPFGSALSGSDIVDDGIWVYTQRAVIDKNFVSNDTFVTAQKAKELKGFAVKSGDILITTRGTIGKTAIVPPDAPYGVLHPCVIRFRIDESKYDKELLSIIFNESDLIQQQIMDMSNSTTIEVLYSYSLKEIRIPVPNTREQGVIKAFLKRKCDEANTLIADIQSQIDTLEQYKRSVITETVTKGLNSDAAMKDSGIEWVGEIPEHWDCIRGKYLLKYIQKPVKDTDGVITCFRDGEVTLRSNRREDGFTMADKEIGYQGIDVGDLVVHGMDGFAGAIGISDSRGKASPVLNVLDTAENKKYIMYYLRSMAYNDVFTALATGIRVRSCDLRWNKLAELPYPVPTLEEQNAIVEHIDSAIEQANALIADKKQQLETLDQYKKSLIYEYVTGKKQVKENA